MKGPLVFALAAMALLASLASKDLVAEPARTPEKSLYNLDQTWTREDGERVKLASLRGQIVIVAMGYATCKDMCPAIVADMMWIDRHLPPKAKGKVKFAFFTFDSVADTPERLRLYADGHGLDLSHWSLFNSEEDSVRDLAAALDVGWRPDGAGGFNHTAVISLLDAEGDVVFQQRGVEADSHELLTRLTTLLAPSPSPARAFA